MSVLLILRFSLCFFREVEHQTCSSLRNYKSRHGVKLIASLWFPWITNQAVTTWSPPTICLNNNNNNNNNTWNITHNTESTAV